MIPIKRIFKRFFFIVALLAFLQFLFYYQFKSKLNFSENIKFIPDYGENEKISWENKKLLSYEKSREGPGENNEPYKLTDPADIAKNEELYKQEGFYVLVSDKISLDRALPDYRPKPCTEKKYNKNLPTVSIIVTFHNEVWSVLLRCVHSIYRRSPKKVLHEIILVNDGSTFPELYEPLQKYFNGTFDSKVKIHNNEERQGLIKARMTGAKLAEAEVIIFLDSHMEVAISWLPPLLDPLVYHPTYATAPDIDGMNFATFSYDYTGRVWRGIFDWSFRYQWLPFSKKSSNKPALGENYNLSSMTGGAYAIRRDHFFHLGGYDEQLQIWNGENYEISLKLWLCGGGILRVPCSRVLHLNKMQSAYRTTGDNSDFIGRNLKRVAEVWLDDYKKYFYQTDQARFDKIDVGDLTKQFDLKKKLNCKPFKYYLDVIAPEMLERFPIEPKYFASFSVKNQGLSQCLKLQKGRYDLPLILKDCSENLKEPKQGSHFTLTLEKSIRYNDANDQCLVGENLYVSNCHHLGGYQYFIFNITTRQIYYPSSNKCLTGISKDSEIKLVDCDVKSYLQKWYWGYENVTALNNWENTGIDPTDLTY